MRNLVVSLLCIGSLAVGTTAVEAKGCIKGALVGGVAGHYAGHHALLGAAAGCLAGRHLAKQRATAPTATTDIDGSGGLSNGAEVTVVSTPTYDWVI